MALQKITMAIKSALSFLEEKEEVSKMPQGWIVGWHGGRYRRHQVRPWHSWGCAAGAGGRAKPAVSGVGA